MARAKIENLYETVMKALMVVVTSVERYNYCKTELEKDRDDTKEVRTEEDTQKLIDEFNHQRDFLITYVAQSELNSDFIHKHNLSLKYNEEYPDLLNELFDHINNILKTSQPTDVVTVE
jgi:hypothetical protein